MNISLFAATMQCLWRRRGGREAEERGFESNVTKQIKQIKYIHNNWNRLWSKRDTTEMVLFDKAEDSRLANNAWVSFWWHYSKLAFIDKTSYFFKGASAVCSNVRGKGTTGRSKARGFDFEFFPKKMNNLFYTFILAFLLWLSDISPFSQTILLLIRNIEA